jgi:hypothetical protein
MSLLSVFLEASIFPFPPFCLPKKVEPKKAPPMKATSADLTLGPYPARFAAQGNVTAISVLFMETPSLYYRLYAELLQALWLLLHFPREKNERKQTQNQGAGPFL